MLVYAAPALLGTSDLQGPSRNLADELAAFDQALSLKKRLDEIAATMAATAASAPAARCRWAK